MPFATLNSGKIFEVQKGTSILDAASNAKIQIPFGCRAGRCKVCKCKVLVGNTYPILREDGLSDNEKLNGWILSCSRSIESDVILAVEDLSEFKLPIQKTFPCKIAKITKLSSKVIQVFLKLPPTALFDFFPGQYIELISHNGVRRSYSVANSNVAGNGIELHIGLVHGGVMSNYWFNSAKENDLLMLYGPLGTFFLRNLTGLDLVFLATGTGIAPVKAMLESFVNLASEELPKSVTVFWGGRFLEDFYIDISKVSIEKFRFVPVLSRPKNSWLSSVGYVQDVFLSSKPDLTRTVVFACGSDAMIRDARVVLLGEGLPDTRFFSDAFVPSAPSAR